MKRILLLCLLLLWLPAAMAEEAAPAAETGALAITTADGLTVTHIVNDPNLASFTDAELLMQHYAATGEYDKAFTLNQQMAVQGDLDALYRVGCHYLTGVGVDRDEAAAMECLQDASLLGHADAARVLADMPSEAAIQLPGWDDPAIQAQAALALGEFWREGRGGTVDAAHAIRWYEHAASLAIDPEASWAHEALADMYLLGEAGAIDPEKAIAHLLQHTLYQGAYGQYRVGRLYWDGLTAEDGMVLLAPDREAALPYLTYAAEAAYTPACAFAGDVYRTGEGVATDPRLAAHYYALGLPGSTGMDCYEALHTLYTSGALYDRAIIDEIYACLRLWQGTDHRLAILLADSLLNGVNAEDGTPLVQQDRKAACELMESFCDDHRALHDVPEIYFLNWLGWFYSGNAPEAVQQDYGKALSFYIESANQGNGYAMAMAGVFYQNGRGMPVDHMSARAWYKRALAAGYASAQGYLDALNASYPEYPVDLAAVITTPGGLTLNHVVNPTGEAAFSDAEMYLYGLCVEGSWTEALAINQQMADLGDVDAMARLGVQYAGGHGTVQDDTLALAWLRKASVAGSYNAVYHLACMYHNGWGVAADPTRAAELLASLNNGSEPLTTRPQADPVSAEQVNPAILLELAAFWTEGRGGAVDIARAAAWYEYMLANFPAETAACYPMALILRDGAAGTTDPQRAVTLFCRAGAMEEAACMFDTGVTAEDGRILLAPNAIVADALRTWAAAPGDPTAGALLGDIFRDGGIVPANANQAAAFYWAARESLYCADQLAALVQAGLVTDEALLRQIAEENE